MIDELLSFQDPEGGETFIFSVRFKHNRVGKTINVWH